jgi:hypothetical protein
VKYEGGQGIVAATNPQTGEVIGYAHVKGVKSQADLDRNLKSGKKNGAGSTFIGTIGGTGDGARGYVHGHIDIYKNAKARADIKQQKSRNGNLADATNTSGYSNFRKFISIFKRH